MNESILSKNDIANYLYNYHQITCGTIINKFLPFYEVFSSYLKNTNQEELICDNYYFEMFQIYMFYLMKVNDSIIYDDRFDNFKVDNPEIVKKLDSFFVNKDDSKKFNDKKKIIKYIRDAINHNDYKNEKYVIKRINGTLYIEIKFNDVRTQKEKNLNFPIKPFHVLISLKELIEIMHYVNLERKMINNFAIVNNNTMKLTVDNCYRLLDDFEIGNHCVEVSEFNKENIQNNFNLENYYHKYQITPYMKKKIVKDIKIWNKLGFNLDEAIYYSILTVFPFPSFKYLPLVYQFDLSFYYALAGKEMNLVGISQELYNVVTKRINIPKSIFNEYNNSYLPPYALASMAYDWDYNIYFTGLIYLGYITENMLNDEEIRIGKQVLPRNHIRNSLVHARWNLTLDGIEFHDWRGLKGEEMFQEKPVWNERITSKDLFDAINSYSIEENKMKVLKK